MRNYLITYPRSGVNWTINRMKALIKLAGPSLWDRERESRFIRMNHLGFSPEDPVEGKEFSFEIGNRKIFTILRDARKCLVSNWYFIQAHSRIQQRLEGRLPESLRDLNSFLLSPYAVRKYCNFLERIREFKANGHLGKVYFYEDVQDESFMYDIPTILGVNFTPSAKLARQAHKASSEVINTFGTDHTAASQESLEAVQMGMNNLCTLEEYRKRYLVEGTTQKEQG